MVKVIRKCLAAQPEQGKLTKDEHLLQKREENVHLANSPVRE